MCESCDKIVIVPPRIDLAGWKKTKTEASPARIFPTVDVGIDTCPCTCMRVGKNRLPNVMRTEISLQIATGVNCF